MQKSLNIIRYCILTGIFIIPFIVLYVSGSLFFPFITGKNFLFRILVELIFGLWLVLAIFDKKYRPQKSWILTAVISFVAILTLSTIFSVNPYRSFWSNFERMEGLVTYLHLLAYFLVLSSVIKTEKIWSWFFHTSLGASVLIGLYGLLQMAGQLEIHQSSNRLDATLGNASYLAIYMVFNIFLGAFLFFRREGWLKWLYPPIILLNTIILYNTATRGAILGLIGGIMLAGLLVTFFSKKRERVRFFGISLFVLSIVFIGIFWSFRTSSFVQQNEVLSRFANISLTERTTESRFVIWKMSLGGLKEKPILGWGLENYNLVFNKYYEPILWRQETWFDRAHNVFVDRLITNGILGLFTYLGLFASLLYYVWLKRERIRFSFYDSAFLTSMFAAYFFHNLFVFDNLISLILFFTFLAYGHSRVVATENLAGESPNSSSNVKSDNLGTKSAYTIVVTLFMIFVFYLINVSGILAASGMIKSFYLWQTGDPQTAFQEFQKVISYDSFGTVEAREHFARFSAEVVNSAEIDQNFKNTVFNYAVSEMQKQNEWMPGDIRTMIFLSSMYNKAGQYDKSIELLNEAVELSPKKQILYFELGTSYLEKQDYSKALEVLRTAFELEPGYGVARSNYAMAAIYNEDYDLVEELTKDSGGTIGGSQKFINAYASHGRYDKVAVIWENLIEKDPTYLQYRISLAATYLQLDRRQDAIDQIEKSIEINPAFKKEGEYYIGEIKAGRNP